MQFYDSSDVLIGSDVFTYLGNPQNGYSPLQWHGWASTTGIKKATYSGDFVAIDALQANISAPDVPEMSASVLAMIPCVLGLIWRRKR